jgi:hypothetical protein
MSENHDMFQSWLPNTETITVFGIADNCVSQLKRKAKQVQQLEQRLQSSEQDGVKLSSELRSIRDENSRLVAHRQELLRDISKTQNTAHVAQVDAASTGTELESLKATVMGVFAFACDFAQTELKIKPASLSDRTATAALGGIRTILSLIGDRFRNAATPEEMEACQAELTRGLSVERTKVQGLERSLHEVDHRLVPYVRSAVPKGSANVIQDASEGLHIVRQGMAQATVNLATFLHCSISEDVRSGDLLGFARTVDELSAETIRKALRIFDATAVVSESLGLPRLDVGSTTSQLRSWADTVVGAFARSRNESEQIANRLSELISRYGSVAKPAAAGNSRSSSFARSSSTEPVVSNISANTSSAIHHNQVSTISIGHSSSVFERQLGFLQDVEEILKAFASHQLHLTSQWQSLSDQSQRLTLEKQSRDAEHERLRDHITQLRAIVQKKLLDDKQAETQMRQLDNHLESQAKELAAKYQMDRDLIVRRFSELRGTIHKMIRPGDGVSVSSRSSSLN